MNRRVTHRMHLAALLPLAGALACAPLATTVPSATTAAKVSTAASTPLPEGLTQPVVSPRTPRTPDGKPDLQGFWNAATLTPLERPRNAQGRTITAEQAQEIEKRNADRVEAGDKQLDPNRSLPPVGGEGGGAGGAVGGYNNFWVDRGTDVVEIGGEARTSLVVDPADGRVPQLTPEGAERRASRLNVATRPSSDAPEQQGSAQRGAFDDIELRPLGERCLIGFGSTSGPPALPVMYNNIKQIVQTQGHVMILNEMVHDARVVRMNAPHLPGAMRRWLGDSTGRWEGDTLVVETTNFTDKTRFRGSTANLKVTERFTRTDEKTLLYQFTVEDAATWTAPWSAEYVWAWSDEPLYEYACHEGNYSIQGILGGERLREAEEAEKAKQAAEAAEKAKRGKNRPAVRIRK